MNEPRVSATGEESLYRTLFEVAGDSIIVCSERGVAIECNQAALKLFACTREKLIGTSPVDWSPEFQPIGRRSDEMAAEVFSRVKAEGMARFDWKNQRADGSLLPVDVTVRHARFEGRDVFVVISRDMTERQQLEVERQEALERFRKITDLVPGVVYQFQWHPDGRTSMPYVSNSFRQLFELDPEDVRADASKALMRAHPDDVESLMASIQESASNMTMWEHEYRLKHEDGSVRWVLGNSLPQLEPDGSKLWHGFITDITERKLTEEALRKSEARYRDLIENAPDAILIHDIDQNRFVEVNRRIEDLMGYSRDEILKSGPVRFFAPVQPDKRSASESISETISRVLAGETVLHEWQLVRADGKAITCSLFLNRLPDPERRLIRVSVTDVTERAEVLRQLAIARNSAEQSDRAKTRFLAAASHDLRQPMQAISLFNEALARTSLSGEQKRISDYLSQSIQSMCDLLDALLDISKLDAGAVKASPEVIPAETLVQKIDAEHSPMATEKFLRFKLHFPFRHMAIRTDGKLLMSLLGNLIGNAIKYTEKGGILVAIRRRRDQALFQVWDTGIGIPERHLETIFEEYFQVGNPERDRTKGLGLGLAIAKRIAKLLETEVVCRSRPGKGSVFEFRLPLVSRGEMDTPSRIDPAAVSSEATPSGRRIVLVEDDLMVATAMKLSLESCGMTVTRYKTAEEALADSAIADADFYISDLRLPGLSGIEFLDALQRRATRPIQAVVVTGDTAIDRIEMMRWAHWRVLFKPVDLSGLLSAIESQDSAH